MNKKELDILAINYIKDKLSLNILNNVYEIGAYFAEDSYDHMQENIKSIIILINIKANITYYDIKIGEGKYEATTETRGKYKYTNKIAEIDRTKEVSYYLIHYEGKKAIVEEEIRDS